MPNGHNFDVFPSDMDVNDSPQPRPPELTRSALVLEASLPKPGSPMDSGLIWLSSVYHAGRWFRGSDD